MKKILITLAFVFPVMVIGQTQTENYIKNTQYQTETQTGNVPNDKKIETITYFDGLGRPKQTIAKQAGGNRQDIITPVVYDEFGRQVKDYLPYADPNQTSGSNLNYRQQDASFFTAINNRYLAKFPEDLNAGLPNPYSEKNLEASPLSRVISQASPGYDWRPGGGHEIEFEYDSNAEEEVRLFIANISPSYTTTPSYSPTLVSSGSSYYPAGELYKTITRDENHVGTSKNHTTEEFKDKQGRVILKRTFADVDLNNDGDITANESQNAHDTYYVYDEFGNLAYVIPPKVDTSDGVSTVELSELCYQYRYDSRNRLIEKKIPGKGTVSNWEEIVYNKIDQPILTRDSKLIAQNKALFTKYDAYGRVVYTGMVNVSGTRATLQNQANSATAQFEESSGMPPSTIAGTGVFYTNNAYPKENIEEIYTINFYDKYEYGQPLSLVTSTVFGDATVNKPQGLPIGSWVKVLDTGEWIKSVMGYDEKGRVIYTKTINANLTDIVQTLYDFTGKPLKIRSSHQRNSGDIIVTIDNFIYDHMGRLVRQSQCIGDSSLNTDCSELVSNTDLELSSIVTSTMNVTASNSITLKENFYVKAQSTGSGLSFSAKIISLNELIAENHYDELGQLDRKKVGNKATAPLQTVDYNYNIRGWLKQINDPTNLGTDLFTFKIGYNEGSKPLFNGNIALTQWKTKNTDQSLKTYNYFYDAVNRITGATDNTGNYNVSDIQYDKNGNIRNLTRKGHIVENPVLGTTSHFGTMDNLHYFYDDGNKLMSVTDTGNKTFGFKGANTSYHYDGNGNMVSDTNKGITNISYNHLNLPVLVTFTSGYIQYIYSADGVKRKKIVIENGSFTVTTYADNYVYEGNSLKFFNHAEGYVEPVNPNNYSAGFNYIYQYKDYLGNIRLSYADTDKSGTINAPTEIIEENNYYPFGLKHKGYNNTPSPFRNSVASKFKFGGKELTEELGLNTYDFGARNYDAALGRWMNLDPLAEQMRRHSPYNYAFNNPVYFIDPDGMAPRTIFDYQGRAHEIGDDEVTEVYNSNDPPDENEENCCPDLLNKFAGAFKSIFGFADKEVNEMAENGDVEGAIDLAKKNKAAAEKRNEIAHGIKDALELGDLLGIASLTANLMDGEMTMSDGVSLLSVLPIGKVLKIGKGLKVASPGLIQIFKNGGGDVLNNSIISIRETLLSNGFMQTITQNKGGYLFLNNATGEEVRIMLRDGKWDLRIKNSFGNYLDNAGNVGKPIDTHNLNILSK